MQALRFTRPAHRLALRRCLTTAAPVAPSTATTATGAPSLIPLSNVEAQWEKLSKTDQATVQRQLEEVQQRDWKSLSVDEKKAAYYVAFGPHGPRTPVSPPGQGFKVFLSTMGLVGITGLITWTIQARAPPPPKTLTREWQEASNERAREQKLDPFSGISSEGYTGKGFVRN